MTGRLDWVGTNRMNLSLIFKLKNKQTTTTKIVVVVSLLRPLPRLFCSFPIDRVGKEESGSGRGTPGGGGGQRERETDGEERNGFLAGNGAVARWRCLESVMRLVATAATTSLTCN